MAWIDRLDGFGTSGELVQYAKKMKARQDARLLEFEDEKTGLRIKRCGASRSQGAATVLHRSPRNAR